MKTRFMALLALLLLPALAGCGGDLTEKVLGVWKTAEENGRERGFVEISREKLRLDGEREIDIAMEEKDGKVALRRAGTDEVAGVITVVGDDALDLTIAMSLGAVRLQLKRSSPEEMNALYHPPLEKIAGIWRTESKGGAPEESSFIEISADAVSVDGAKTSGTFTTNKGVYSFAYEGAGGRGPQRFFFNKEGRLIRAPGAMYYSQTLIPSSAEEAAAAKEAKRAAIEKHFGFWRVERLIHREALAYLELGADGIDDNGETTAATPVYTEGGSVKWFKEGAGSEILTTKIVDGDRLEANSGYFSRNVYLRSDREGLEKLNNPKLEDFIGFWMLADPGVDSFRAVEIGADYIVFNNRREPIRADESWTNGLILIHPHQPRDYRAAILSHIGDGQITLNYGNSEKTTFAYRRVGKDEYAEAARTLVDPLTVIPGFWRSEEKVRGNSRGVMVYATAAFARNVRGKKGDAVDWASHNYISSRSRNASIDAEATVREGKFTIKDGLASNPVVLADEPGSNQSWVQVRVLGPDALEISTTNSEYLRCVRCTREELIEYRKQIEDLY